MPSIDHTKQRLRLQNIIDSASTALVDLSGTATTFKPANLNLVGPGVFSKVPKTMHFVVGIVLSKEAGGGDTRSASNDLSTIKEEVKKASSSTTRKKVIASKA